MNDEYEEVTGTEAVPQATGITGFLKVIESVLKLPRVQEITINAKGEIKYRYFLKAGEAARTLDIDLESVTPAMVIRNNKLEELPNPSGLAPMALCQLFNLVARDRLHPVAFVVGPNTCLWDWYTQTAGFAPIRRDELHGVPLLVEKKYEEQTLVLCASYTRSAALIDTQSSYKLVIPKVMKVIA
jgi:hypothetical protein